MSPYFGFGQRQSEEQWRQRLRREATGVYAPVRRRRAAGLATTLRNEPIRVALLGRLEQQRRALAVVGFELAPACGVLTKFGGEKRQDARGVGQRGLQLHWPDALGDVGVARSGGVQSRTT